MRFTSKQKLFVTAAVSLLAVGFLGGAFWKLSGIIENSDARLQNIESKIFSFEEERTLARTAEGVIKARRDDIGRINGFFVDRERPIEFIESLERIAKETRNKMALDFDEGRSKEERLFFRITAEGEEKNVRKFLRLLEFMPYEIRIEDLSFQRIGVSTGVYVPPVPGKKAGEAPPSLRLFLFISVKAI